MKQTPKALKSDEYKGSPRGERGGSDRQEQKSSKSARATPRNIEKTALAIARTYISQGWNPVRVKYRKKKPTGNEWQTQTITDENVLKYFGTRPQNIGVQLGPKSGGLCDVDLDCSEAIQFAPHFLPSTGAVFGRNSKPGSHYLYKVNDAEPVSWVQHKDESGDMIVELRLGAKPDTGVQTVFPGSTHESGEQIKWVKDGKPAPVLFAEIAHAVKMLTVTALLSRHWPQDGSHDVALRVGGFLARAGVATNDIEHMVKVITRETGNRNAKEHARTAGDAARGLAEDKNTYGYPKMCETFGEKVVDALARILGGDASNLPLIKIAPGELSKNSDEAERVLLEANVAIYQRTGALVRPVVEEVDAAHGRKTKVAQLKDVSAVYLRDLLGRVAVFRRYDSRSKKYAPTNPPSEVACTILGRVGEWSFPIIAGVISTPTMRPDGSLLTEPGYDVVTRLLLVDPPSMPPIPDKPSRKDALASLALLDDLLTEFPFVDDVAKAVALSAIISPVVRGAFPVAPMHVARAPVAGSGKSFLFDVVAAIAIGQRMPVMAAGRNEEETEKRLGAALLAGQPLISLDNVNGELKGDALCQIIERPIVDIRILGKSERVRIETKGTTTYCTGNNVTLFGDLCRRAITITLDPQLERPELRQFRGSPVEKVLADRGAYIAACLTICRAYIVAGRPNKAQKLASFEGWSNTPRSALLWLGKADPVASMEVARAEDPELIELGAFLQAFAKDIGVGVENCSTMKDLVDRATEKTGDGAFRSVDLHAAVRGVVNVRRDIDARGVGNWARAKKGRIVGGFCLANKLNSHGASLWWVEKRGGV